MTFTDKAYWNQAQREYEADDMREEAINKRAAKLYDSTMSRLLENKADVGEILYQLVESDCLSVDVACVCQLIFESKRRRDPLPREACTAFADSVYELVAQRIYRQCKDQAEKEIEQ